MHEVSMSKCTRITRSLRRIGVEASDLPTYEGLSNIVPFLIEFEAKVIDEGLRNLPPWTLC